MIRDEIKKLIKNAVDKEFGKIEIPEIEIEKPENVEFGDYSSNVAMQLAKVLKKEPREIVRKLESGIRNQGSEIFGKIEVAGPGFINFYLSKEYLQKQVGEIGEKFGSLDIGKKQKINVEFISANPTGPLTLGNGRGGFCGDVLANILEKAGYKVTREYYINDIGEQVRKLGKGEYDNLKEVSNIRSRIKEKNPQKTGEMMAKIILEENIKPFIKEKLKINFDVWFSEKSLHKSKKVDKVLNFLEKKGWAYEKEGALWFKSTQFGDDKDRVLVKADGEKTYFASDVAYLKNKFGRGFDKLIYIWGADHYGYIGRIKAAAQALGYNPEKVAIIIMQLVAVMWTRGGKEEILKMSKRKGIYMGIDDLIKKLGLDVVRFFFLMRSPGSHLIFNYDLAQEKSEKNPVYYIQYAYARICSIIKKSKVKSQKSKLQLKTQKFINKLENPYELNLIRQLIRLPEIVKDIAKDYQVQRLPNYALELVTAFHKFYEECRVISEDKNLTQARLSLVQATKIVLKNTLDLMGISAPEKM